MIESLLTLFSRDLNKLITELESYNDEDTLWIIADGIKNSAGNLALHLVGNINHFIGHVLGNTDYIRKRDLEFSQKNIPRVKIIQDIRKTIEMLESVLPSIDNASLQANYQVEVFGHPMTTEFFLMHLSTHLSYHLGQINYHRRMI